MAGSWGDALVQANASTIGGSIPSSNTTPSIDLDSVHIGVISSVTIVVALVFIFVYVQLMAVLYYGYKLLSYQTIFLFDILIWASLQLTHYSFYFFHCCTEKSLINRLPVGVEWLLVSSPSIFLFVSLSLLVHYFMESMFKLVRKRQEVHYLNPSYRHVECLRYISTGVWGLSLFLYVCVNVSFGIVIGEDQKRPLITSRVVVLEGLMLLMGLVLGVCILVIYTTKIGKDIMESKQVSKIQAIFISILLIILFSSRTIYNIVAAAAHDHTFGYNNLTTGLADFDSSKQGDIVYFCVLLLWEVIPICLIVLFFRVRMPPSVKSWRRCIRESCSISRRLHFFDTSINDDRTLNSATFTSSIQKSNRVKIPIIPEHPYPSLEGYGSTSASIPGGTYSMKRNTPSFQGQGFMPGTTPPQLFTGSPTVFSDSNPPSTSH